MTKLLASERMYNFQPLLSYVATPPETTLTTKMNDFVCLLLKFLSGSEKSRLEQDVNQQDIYSKCSKWWPLALTHARSRVRHWSTTLSVTLCGSDDVMATRHLRRCKILQRKVSSQEVR